MNDETLTRVLASREFRVARDFCEDGGESEYVRACAEMVLDLTGTSQDYKEQVIAALIAPSTMREFEVSLTNTFTAESAQDAVKGFVMWLHDTNPDRLGYRVTDTASTASDPTTFVDADDIEWSGP